MSRKADIQKEISNWERRLRILKEKKALMGISSDPSIDIEITDIESTLRKLRANLEIEIGSVSQSAAFLIQKMQYQVASKQAKAGQDQYQMALNWAKDGRRVSLARLYLHGADLRLVDLFGANLQASNLTSSDLRQANLKNADLRVADLQNADLRRANLEGANLEGANLKDTNLEGANLKGANLEGTNREGVVLRGANLEGANFPLDDETKCAIITGCAAFLVLGGICIWIVSCVS